MSLVLLLGGARSGKSRLAVELVTAWRRPVVVVATAEARDEEMTARIARHRAERPAGWETIEEPVDIEAVLAAIGEESSVLLDCLTLWVSNLMERGAGDDDIEEQARRTAGLASTRSAGVVAVTNEVGSGVVPETALGRRFCDVLGRVNTVWAKAADRSALIVAGKVLPLGDAEVLSDL